MHDDNYAVGQWDCWEKDGESPSYFLTYFSHGLIVKQLSYYH